MKDTTSSKNGWYKYNSSRSYNNPLTILRDNYKYEIIDIAQNLCRFTNYKPRPASKYWSKDYIIWHIEYNAQVRQKTA